jgi:hypothetical protein
MFNSYSISCAVIILREIGEFFKISIENPHSFKMSDISKEIFWQSLLKKLVDILAKPQGRKRKSTQGHQHVVHQEGWAERGKGNKRITAI